jgi:dipeptidyl aminopeptidase/acylaminoacyl peptidase
LTDQVRALRYLFVTQPNTNDLKTLEEKADQITNSDNGSLFYIPAGQFDTKSIIALADAVSGKVTPLPLPPQPYFQPRISPDGRKIVFATFDNGSSTVYVYDLNTGGAARRITFEGSNGFPIWSHDGTRVTHSSTREGDSGIFWQPSEGGVIERLTKTDGANIIHRPEAWSLDGKTLVYTVFTNGVGDLWTLSIDGERKPKPFVTSQGSQRDAAFSPNGRWIAYSSSEIGNRSQIFVQPFPPSGEKKDQITTDGGAEPVWSADGKHLYYEADSRLYTVEIHTEPVFGFGKPMPLPIRGLEFSFAPTTRSYDVMPDGRLLVVRPASAATDQTSRQTEQINAVFNWFEELKQRVPVHEVPDSSDSASKILQSVDV